MTEEQLAAPVLALAQAGIPPDIQELLVWGNPSRGIAPGALAKAIAATRPDPAILAAVEAVIEARRELYVVKQSRHDALADDTCTEWERVQHTIEALDALRREVAAAIRSAKEG